MSYQYCRFKRTILWLMAPALLIWMAACSGSRSNDASSNIYEELEHVLRKDVVELWYPRAIDTLHGGYLSDFDFQWRQDGPQNKMIVSQARHVWTCSKLAELYPEGPYIDYASHGVMGPGVWWVSQFGASKWTTNRQCPMGRSENSIWQLIWNIWTGCICYGYWRH